MKLFYHLILIVILFSVSFGLSVQSKEELLKSMSVFDVIDSEKPASPAPSLGNSINPNQNNPALLPPGVPIPNDLGNSQIPAPQIMPQMNMQSEVNNMLFKVPENQESNIQDPINNQAMTQENYQKVKVNPQTNKNVQQIIENIKSKVTNPYLRANFTLPNIANFFANFISGNEYLNNLEVKESSRLKNLEVSGEMNVKKKAKIQNLEVTNMYSRVMNITKNEIVFDPDTLIKMKNSRISFKIKDIFEVIAFMKYIVRICGTRLEKCDFKSLLIVNKTEEIEQLVKYVNAVNSKLQTTHNITKEVNNTSIPIKMLKKSKKLRGGKDYKFKQTSQMEFEKVEKELSTLDLEQSEARKESLDTEYISMMENPSMQQYLNDYYYNTQGQHTATSSFLS